MNTLKKLFWPVTATIDYIQNHFKAMIFLLLLVVIFYPSHEEQSADNNLQSIELSGPIFDATVVVEQLEKARTDKQIKGVMLVVNSPGGAVPPSLEIAEAVKRLHERKPVLVYAKGMLTSGAYYASIWADEIMANPGALVGSIGVIMQGADLQGLMEKLGVKTQVATAGKFKQVGTSDRPWKPFERQEIEKVIDATYAMFVGDVARARQLDTNKSGEFADAHIFTSAQAKAVGLIDTLGVEFDAKERLKTLSGVHKAIWNRESRFDRFLQEIGSSTNALIQLYFPAQSLQ